MTEETTMPAEREAIVRIAEAARAISLKKTELLRAAVKSRLQRDQLKESAHE